MIYVIDSQSRFGKVALTGSDKGLATVDLGYDGIVSDDDTLFPDWLLTLAHQIPAYLRGQECAFTTPIDWDVLTSFQADALKMAWQIPYGQIRTYGDIALALHKKNGARAVGMAMSTNPMPLIVPCHRVVGANGQMHGYSGPGGVAAKAWLLQLESGQQTLL